MEYIISQRVKSTCQKIQVSKIMCLGLNYLNHISEMNAVKPEKPVIFLKPPSAIIHNDESIIIPDFSKEVHHEVEIVMVIGKTGKNIPKEHALDYLMGFAVGLDVTLRDIQGEAKKKGQPWSVSKGFDTSSPISEMVSKKRIKDLNNIEIKLWVNDELRQEGNSQNMIFKFDEIISYLSGIFTLNRGDLIFTGTPEGVGIIKHGDKLKATLNDLVTLQVDVKSNNN